MSELFALPPGSSSHLHFAPDGSQLAVLPSGEATAIRIHAVPNGALVANLPLTAQPSFFSDRMLRHLGDAVVHLETWEHVDPYRGRRWWRLVRHRLEPTVTREVLFDGVESHGGLQMGSVPGGFVAVAADRLWLGGAAGEVRERAIPTVARAEGTTFLGSDHASGRIAISLDYGKRVVVLDERGELVRTLPLAEHGPAWFVDANTLVTYGGYRALQSWSLLDGGFVKEGAAYLVKEHVQSSPHQMPLGVTVLRSRGLLAYAIENAAPAGYDVRTMKPAPLPGLLATKFPIWVSADERYAVMAEYAGLRVHDLARAMGS